MPPYTRAQRTKREVVRVEQSNAQRTEAVRRREEEEGAAQEHSENYHTEEKAEEEEEKQSKRELKKKEQEKQQKQKKEKRENVNTKPELVEGVSFDQVFKWHSSFVHRGGPARLPPQAGPLSDGQKGRAGAASDWPPQLRRPFRFVRQREDDFCQERNPGLPMKEINRFEHELQTKLGKHVRIPHELRQLYRFCNGLSLGCDIRILPLADALKAECRDHDEVDLEDDCSAMRHPAWIPFAEDGDYDVYLINTNLQSQTFGEVKQWTLNCGEEEDSARSLYCYLSSIRARCVA